MRVGIGVDAHGFDASMPLVLGGVEFPDMPGLSGHSDGDVVAHALIDALLGAANLGDIGAMFPSDDDELAGISSLLLLSRAYRRVHDAGYELVNAHCVLIGSGRRSQTAAPRWSFAWPTRSGSSRIGSQCRGQRRIASASQAAAKASPLRLSRYCGSATDPASWTTSLSRISDSTASRSRPRERPPATRRRVSARRWRNEPSNRDCLRSGS